MVWLVTVQPVVFSSAHDRSVSCPLKTTPSLFLHCVEPLILELCSFWNPSWVVLLPQKLTQPGKNQNTSSTLQEFMGDDKKSEGQFSLGYQNFKERRLQHPGSCFVSPQSCPSLGMGRAGAGLGGDRQQGPSLDGLCHLSFLFLPKK